MAFFVKCIGKFLKRLTKQSLVLMTLKKKPVENIVGKGAFSPFPTMFSTLQRSNFNFLDIFVLSSADPFNLD